MCFCHLFFLQSRKVKKVWHQHHCWFFLLSVGRLPISSYIIKRLACENEWLFLEIVILLPMFSVYKTRLFRADYRNWHLKLGCLKGFEFSAEPRSRHLTERWLLCNSNLWIMLSKYLTADFSGHRHCHTFLSNWPTIYPLKNLENSISALSLLHDFSYWVFQIYYPNMKGRWRQVHDKWPSIYVQATSLISWSQLQIVLILD